MAKYNSATNSVTVEKGDTLSEIAQDFKTQSGGLSYRQIGDLNGIKNYDLIYVGQVIKLSGTTTSSSSGSKTSSSPSNKPVITGFGLLATGNDELFATWSWPEVYRNNTQNYKCEWSYTNGSKDKSGKDVWFYGSGGTSTTTVLQSTFSIPDGAVYIVFRVLPVSATKTVDGKSTTYFTAQWSDKQSFNVKNQQPPDTPTSAPSVTVEKFQLTAEYDNLDSSITQVEFQVIKDNNGKSIYATGKSAVSTGNSSYSCTLAPGGEYKVRARFYKGSLVSDWSPYSSNYTTIPASPAGITSIKAATETSVYLEWSSVPTAETYEIEYATKITYFDITDQTTTKNGIKTNHYEITGLESGSEYFFRVRAVNKDGNSAWCEPRSTVIGEKPAAPTTWSSTTTAIVGNELNLYWVHNAIDGSSQTYAELELTIAGTTNTYTIKNTEDEELKDKTSVYPIDTTDYEEGVQILWRVRTAGITLQYGDWSVQRTIDIYAPPSLEFRISDEDDNSLDTITTFPFYAYALAGPNTQAPIGYHLTITSNEVYETVDNIGNDKTVNAGEAVYSKQFDISDPLLVEISASNIDLENGVSYTATCTVSMNSGLTKESSVEFTVNWAEQRSAPNAEISLDRETLVTYIRPYCEDTSLVFYKVEGNSGNYTATNEVIEVASGVSLEENEKRVYTKTGEQVFTGKTAAGADILYCTIEETALTSDVTLSVYRREFDGSFTELATGLKNEKQTCVTDPHPSLDFARYRVVATSTATGTVSYYDVPGYPIGEPSFVIQWDEDWSNFDVSSEDELVQPPWSGSLLKLLYNIDFQEDYKPDVSLINYAGRKNPVSYYGTQTGTTSSGSVEILKSDKETLYALRRLAVWMGDVYFREPSGVGYWANIVVNFGQTHKELTIPVSLSITRVEGGA